MTHAHRRLLRFAGAGTCAALIFASGMYAARAGTAAPPLAASLSFSGVLQQDGKPLTTAQNLVFTFKKADVAQCSSPSTSASPDSSGRFDVQIALDACPTSLFDGASVVVDISVGGTVVSQDVPVAAVPYALHAEQLGSADCPSGYASVSSTTARVLCEKGIDQVVRVGTGATAFWIDRFEASTWDDSAGQNHQYDASTGYPASFPPSAQVSIESSLFAISEASVLPSVGLTWPQMNRACRNSGKRLPTTDEWLEAANSTPSGGAGDCLIGGYGVRTTGQAKTCLSVWGAEDMVGNAGEITAEWVVDQYAAPTVNTTWPDNGFLGGLWNVSSYSWSGKQEPLVAAHGGAYYDAMNAGVYAYSLSGGVSEPAHGFRCMIPR